MHGAGRGQQLGFPTLNVACEASGLEHGVYAAWVRLNEGLLLPGALHYGVNRTFEEGSATVEIFLLDFSGEVYGQTVVFEVVKKIRDTKKFDSAEALVVQIAKDVERVREVLKLDCHA